jgi:hypothetical protein
LYQRPIGSSYQGMICCLLPIYLLVRTQFSQLSFLVLFRKHFSVLLFTFLPRNAMGRYWPSYTGSLLQRCPGS